MRRLAQVDANTSLRPDKKPATARRPGDVSKAKSMSSNSPRESGTTLPLASGFLDNLHPFRNLQILPYGGQEQIHLPLRAPHIEHENLIITVVDQPRKLPL